MRWYDFASGANESPDESSRRACAGGGKVTAHRTGTVYVYVYVYVYV